MAYGTEFYGCRGPQVLVDRVLGMGINKVGLRVGIRSQS